MLVFRKKLMLGAPFFFILILILILSTNSYSATHLFDVALEAGTTDNVDLSTTSKSDDQYAALNFNYTSKLENDKKLQLYLYYYNYFDTDVYDYYMARVALSKRVNFSVFDVKFTGKAYYNKNFGATDADEIKDYLGAKATIGIEYELTDSFLPYLDLGASYYNYTKLDDRNDLSYSATLGVNSYFLKNYIFNTELNINKSEVDTTSYSYNESGILVGLIYYTDTFEILAEFSRLRKKYDTSDDDYSTITGSFDYYFTEQINLNLEVVSESMDDDYSSLTIATTISYSF
ncbi:MAG: hypothetical protein ISR65_10600 [Bacteriovoracaceae bacterium]|nr:hypothetical protein [Bacteriovoracaceae bacterium]